MDLTTQQELALELRKTNASFRSWLGKIDPLSSPGPAACLHIDAILSELLRAGECLRQGFPAEPFPDLDCELSAYRHNLEQLRDHMPYIHAQLIRERARLEEERARLESAEEWARRSRQSL